MRFCGLVPNTSLTFAILTEMQCLASLICHALMRCVSLSINLVALTNFLLLDASLLWHLLVWWSEYSLHQTSILFNCYGLALFKNACSLFHVHQLVMTWMCSVLCTSLHLTLSDLTALVWTWVYCRFSSINIDWFCMRVDFSLPGLHSQKLQEKWNTF